VLSRYVSYITFAYFDLSTTMTPTDGIPWDNDIEFIIPRFLQQNESGDDLMVVATDGNTTQILRNSLRLYGSLFAVGFISYCFLRKRIPRTFAVRQWIPQHKTPLAQDQFGYISWIWKVYSFSEDDLLDTIGLDALCFLRVLNMGFRLSCIGVCNSIWLFPVYTTDAGSQNDSPDDPVRGSTINILPDGSPRFAATVVAAYIFFGYVMYSILKDFLWFIEKRHTWLKRFNVRNYTILIRNIPEELRSDQLLKEHYQRLYGHDRGKEAFV
jgi:calcium permeable stress-gated cation channel